MATPLPLEGDGLIDNLFHFLWSKDDFNAGPRIFVPHTVVYKGAQPAAWYFTSLKTGKIKKKNKTNLTNLQIEHEFTKHNKRLAGGGSSTDIVACYLYQVPNGNGSSHNEHDDPSAPSTTTIVEYLDAATLHDFLFSRDKTHNGILQRFVLPKGTHNATIRAIWSPKICLLERRVNTKSLFDPRFSVYERGVTFDGGGGGELFSRPEPVRGAMLPGEVQLLCEQVVDHVTQVSYHKYRISRMVLHLKSDAEDRLWLLWCSSLRLLRVNASASGDVIRPLDIVSDAQVPAHISLGHVSHQSPSTQTAKLKSSHSEPQLKKPTVTRSRAEDRDAPLRDGFQRCTSCASVVEQHRMLTTNYKAVLEHFSRFLLFLRLKVNEKEQVAIEWPPDPRLVDAAGGVGFGILPFCEKKAAPTSTNAAQASPAPHLAGLNAKELIIPPVIQYLHPTLGVDDFERHRHDPIFLHKPVAVCESCCLVYSDYTTTALEVNSLRPNVPAILRPQREVNELKRRLDPIDPVTMAVTTSPTKTAKPLASAWKPIPRNTNAKGASLGNGVASGLTRSTLHALPPAPTLPERIESLAAFIGSVPNSEAPLMDDSNPHTEVQKRREEAFFRELYHQQGVEVDDDGHPLHHMLESSDKLAQLSIAKKKQLAAIHNGVQALDSDDRSIAHVDWRALGKSASMSALDNVLGKKTTKNPYTVVQKLGADASHPRARKPKHKSSEPASSQSKYDWLQEDGGEDEDEERGRRGASKSPTSSITKPTRRSNNSKSPVARRYVSTREVQASEAHQEFLFAALHDAQQQLDSIGSLSALVLPESESTSSSRDTTHSVMSSQELDTREELQSVLSENASLPSDAQTPDAFTADS